MFERKRIVICDWKRILFMIGSEMQCLSGSELFAKELLNRRGGKRIVQVINGEMGREANC